MIVPYLKSINNIMLMSEIMKLQPPVLDYVNNIPQRDNEANSVLMDHSTQTSMKTYTQVTHCVFARPGSTYFLHVTRANE